MTTHVTTEDRSAGNIVVTCTCGWSITLKSRQNTTAKTMAKAHCKKAKMSTFAQDHCLPPSPIAVPRSSVVPEWPKPDADYKTVGTDYEEREMKDYEYMFGDYWYVVDMKVVRPDFVGQVGQFKKRTGAKIVWLCDMVARGLRPRVR